VDIKIKIDPVTSVFKAIMMWHPINGEWVHIMQEIEDNNIKYFINGVALTELPSVPKEMLDVINACKEGTPDEDGA